MKRKVERGKPLSEMVKGSVQYWVQQVRQAFYRQFGREKFYIEENFADHVIVQEWNSTTLKADEYYLVAMTIGEDDSISFAPQEEWEIVELAYQPQSTVAAVSEGRPKGSTRINEQLDTGVRLLEAKEGETVRKIRAIGITADVVNGNGRRYAAGVLRQAVEHMRSQLTQSPGQGRLVQLLGEAEHPDGKPSGRPNILETVIKWEAISFNESTRQVELEGIILPTSKGRDILTLLENGVVLPISQRAYGLAKRVKEDGQAIEEITDLYITGYDLVMEASDPVAQITESKSKQEDEMDPEEIKALLLKALQESPELVKGLFKGDIEALSEAQLQTIEANVRKALGIGDEADLGKALAEAAEAKRTLEAQKHDAAVEAAIVEQTKGLKYGEKLNATFVEAVRAAKPADGEAVKAIVETKRVEYDAVMAQARLAAQGYRIEPVGPVFEQETGWPEFARPSFVLTEAIRRKTLQPARDLRKPKTMNEAFAARYLEAYDKAYKGKLLSEMRQYNEAEQTSDLDLPYSVMRAIIAEAFPSLIATGIFDVEMSDTNPAHLYFETFSGETGYTVSAAAEAVVADLDDWVDLDYKRITPGTLVAKDHAETTTYTEGTDYVIDYANGKFMALTAGSITNGQDIHITAYTYTAIRKGEMATIERGKMTLSHEILALAADRLATQISREAVVFSRSQLNYDATSRTLASLVAQIQRKIDQGIMYLGLSAALSVASNSGGTWASTGLPGDFVEYVGVAKTKVANRYYMPTALLLSYTNADKVANWDGFTQAGSRPDADINAEGYIGRIKGLAVFQSTEFSNSYGLVLNRELVMHRIGQPMRLFGPYPSYDQATAEMIAAEQYYAEEFNGSEAPVPGKGAYVKIT